MNSGMNSAFALDGFRAYASDTTGPTYDMLVNDVGDYYIVKGTTSGAVTTYTYHRSNVATVAAATKWTNRADVGTVYSSFEVAFAGYLRGR